MEGLGMREIGRVERIERFVDVPRTERSNATCYMKWGIEMCVEGNRVITRVTNPDGSYGIIEMVVTKTGAEYLGVTNHSNGIDMRSLETGLRKAIAFARARL